MANVLDLVLGVKENSELEFFTKIERICGKFGVRDTINGKTYVNCEVGDGISVGKIFYKENYKMPKVSWAYSEKDDVFLSYIEDGKGVKAMRFSDKDFKNIPSDIFLKVDCAYEKIF